MISKRCLKLVILASKPQVIACKPRNYSQEYVPKALRSLKGKSTRETVQFYVDQQRVRAVAGNGGDGCISFLSVWCKDQAGPDGGDGGHGGHVIFQATHTVKSLNHCKAVITAKHGERGFNKDCHGKNAPHVIVPVPLGTIVKDANGTVVGDLSAEGVMFVAARGGAGGRGNKFFLTDTQQAPDVAELGAEGESRVYSLEVRSMAHVGLIGFPNAGKSTLVRALTRARPAVAPHPFTTLRPHIGMIPYDDYEQVALADLPGLIPGSHRNRGLGIQFLQHVERCRGLVFLLDGTSEPLRQYESLSYELRQYSPQLASRQSCVVVNKIDLNEGKRGLEEVKRGIRDVVRGLEANRGDLEANRGDLEANRGDLEANRGNLEANRGDLEANVGDLEEDVGDSEVIKGDRSDFIVNRGDLKLKHNQEMQTELDNEINMIEDHENNVKSKGISLSSDEKDVDVKVIGISAKTGMNLATLSRIIREMYDNGEQR